LFLATRVFLAIVVVAKLREVENEADEQ